MWYVGDIDHVTWCQILVNASAMIVLPVHTFRKEGLISADYLAHHVEAINRRKSIHLQETSHGWSSRW